MSVDLSKKFTKSDLLKLPHRDWNDGHPSKWYRALLIVPSLLEHDSGWSHIAIIGVEVSGYAGTAEEILAMPDDIGMPRASNQGRWMSDIRMDSFYPQGVLRMWSHSLEFQVEPPMSSVQITTRPRLEPS